MFKSYFLTTLRNLRKNKGYSFLNIFGLAIGIACAGLIFLWTEDEINFDNNHVKKDRLYLVKINAMMDAGVFTHSSSPVPLAPSLKSELPGIANTCRISEGSTSALFNIGNDAVYASGNYAEPSIFSMLTLPFAEGNAQTAFRELHSIVITESAAKKFFGTTEKCVGKSLRMDNQQDYIVSGVLKDLPQNTSMRFEWLASYQVFYQQRPRNDNWFDFGITTLVELKEGADVAEIDKQLYNYIPGKQGADVPSVHAFLFGMKDWRLYDQFDNGKETGGGRIQYVHLFSIIAWIILIIACINFMNLATARSEKRAREVGVRKVLGADKKRLIFQFIGEALLMSLLAAFIAVFIISLLLPLFNVLVEKNLSLSAGSPYHIVALLVLALVCGVISGSYPSLYLSSFNPVFVLKGIKLKTGSATLIRKGLVVLQFAISIILITGTLIIYRQIQHVKGRNLGFNKDNLVEMKAQGEIARSFAAIRQDLLNTNYVENVALADHKTLTSGNNTTSMHWEGKAPGSLIVISQRLVSPEFIATTGMQLSEGADFTQTDIIEMGADHRPKDSSQTFNIIITESMEKLMGGGSAIGKIITRESEIDKIYHFRVKGVVKDYIYGDMYGGSDPVMFYCIPDAARLLYARLKPGVDPEQALAKMGAVMKRDNPAYPFEYKFVDDDFNNMFLSETLVGKLSRIFAALAILISCLGLFGLAAYTAEQRTREIGVRKVLGASVFGISSLLSKEFIRLVVVALVIATPIAWWMMNRWLESFSYRIDISWWMFGIAGMLAILIAIFTVSFQAIKAAIANPVNSLRTN